MIRTYIRAAAALLPLLLLSPSLAQDHDGHAGHGEAAAHDHAATDHEVHLGDLVISGAFTRATLPNAPVAGGFLTLVNQGGEDDVLVSASADIARETQIHEMAMEGDVMKMRQLADGLIVPGGETVELKPGGFHIMLMGLNGPLVEGEQVPVTLTFAKAGTVTIELSVAGTAAQGLEHDHSGH
ncbi:copper chaperone PCu(A)C [Devosia sp. YIM 151766]|uniref:copper chaperone PCu(A)C n=1 Tax=Devosia sp. YIM 151766 TaxID=3017325 RepID=UPI00255CF18B|nr:copper chaperone PCu(A)C [Devosia sp. YIM 151766]WIY52987.1 copper chaperone PCu(A)C [Devosia sp. YIM 151766]